MQNISKQEYLKLEQKKIHNLFLESKYDLVIEKSKEVLKKDPSQIPFYNLLALSYRELGNINRAEEILKNALKINPNDQSVINNLGTTYRAKGEYFESEKFLKLALTNNPNDINALCNYANLKRDTNEFDESIKFYEKAYKINSKIPTIVINLAGAYQIIGKFDLSKRYLEIFLKDNPDNVIAHKLLSSINDYEKDKTHQKQMLLTLEKSSINDYDLSTLNYAIAKSYEDQKNYKKSFEHFKKANDLQRKRNKNYSVNQDVEYFNKIKNIFKDTDFNDYKRNKINKSNLLFIVGLPRSGTTLTHQILSSHSNIYGAGELPHLYNFIKNNIENKNFTSLFKNYSDDNDNKIKDIAKLYISKIDYFKTPKKFTLDKAPLNFVCIGFIKILFPDAKIIHCTRNLEATALSIYKNSFEDSIRWGNNEDDLIKFISIYLDLMKFWQEKIPNYIYNINYEKLIENQKEETKKLIEYCEQNWEDNCLNFNKSPTPIKTVSITQARKPDYKTSLNSYEKYAEYLEMFEKLKDLKKPFK